MFRQSIPLPAVIARIHELCDQKQTGTIYIIENGHITGQFGLQAGEVVSLIAPGKRGTDALSCLLDIKNYGIAFAPGALVPEPMTLPPTSEILAILDSFIGHVAPLQARAPTAPAAPPPPSAPPRPPRPAPSSVPASSPPSPAAPVSASALTATSKTVLEQTLKEFIGPIAKVICADLFRADLTLDDAIRALAAEIPGPKAAAQFRERVTGRLP